MATSLEGLFKTPTQVRADQQKALQEQGLTAAAMLTRGSTGASTALPGLLQGFAGNIAANIPADAQNLVRGSLGAAGAVAGQMGRQDVQQELMRAQMSPEEQRALEMKQKLRKAKGDYEGLKQLGAELLREGNAKEAYGVLQMAEQIKPDVEDGTDMLDSSDIKGIMFAAKYDLKCDINDPECVKQARQIHENTKRENAKELAGYKGLKEKRTEIVEAKESIQIANNALQVLDSGDVNIGAFANTRQGVMKLMATVFPSWEKANQTVANTDLLVSQAKTLAGKMLATGMFGDGTAISDADRASAERIVGASESLTPMAMRDILQFNARTQQKKIEAFNQSLKRYNPEFFSRTIEGSPENFMVDIPPVYKMKEKEQPKEKTKKVTFNEMEIEIPVDAQAGMIKGKLVYKLNGEYYDATTGEKLQ